MQISSIHSRIHHTMVFKFYFLLKKLVHLCKYFAENENMTQKHFFMNIIRISVAIATTAILLSCTPKDRYIVIQGYAQGGTYSIKMNMNGTDGRIRKSPMQIKDAIDSILNDIDTTLSGYNKGSILSRFNAGETVTVERYGMFEDVYTRAYDYWEKTGGALDAASGPLFDLWGFGFTKDSLPSDKQINATLHSCGMGRLRRDIKAVVDANGKLSPEKLLTDSTKVNAGALYMPRLNFNAIAQGYSCDVVAGYLYELGVKDMLVDIGEIYCDGLNPEGKPWKVGVDRPFDGNEEPGKDLDGVWQSNGTPCGIVTSGNYRKFYIKDGKKYAHTIDPRTGYPVQHNLLSATIVAKNATDADAYATYCMVVGLDKAKEFIENNPDDFAGYLIWSDSKGEMHEWASENFVLVN